MVCAFGAALALAGLVYPFFRGDRFMALNIAVVTARWGLAALIAGSAVQLAVSPRADQPLLDMLEHAAPSLRSLILRRPRRLPIKTPTNTANATVWPASN